jgi:hypothetical protein
MYADMLADHLNDASGAVDAYAAVVSVEPGNRRAVHALARLGAQLGRWDDAAGAVVRHCAIREAFDDELLGILEVAAAKAGAYADLATALTSALDKHKLPAAVSALFNQRLSVVYRDQLVASHKAETPSGGSVVYRVQGYALPVTEARRIRHRAQRSQSIGPRGEHPREIPLLLRMARRPVEIAVPAAMTQGFAARRQILVYAHAPMLLSARFRTQRAVR